VRTFCLSPPFQSAFPFASEAFGRPFLGLSRLSSRYSPFPKFCLELLRFLSLLLSPNWFFSCFYLAVENLILNLYLDFYFTTVPQTPKAPLKISGSKSVSGPLAARSRSSRGFSPSKFNGKDSAVTWSDDLSFKDGPEAFLDKKIWSTVFPS